MIPKELHEHSLRILHQRRHLPLLKTLNNFLSMSPHHLNAFLPLHQDPPTLCDLPHSTVALAHAAILTVVEGDFVRVLVQCTDELARHFDEEADRRISQIGAELTREPSIEKFCKEFCVRIAEAKALKQKSHSSAWEYYALDSKIAVFQKNYFQLFNILRERERAHELPIWIASICVLDPLEEEEKQQISRKLKDSSNQESYCLNSPVALCMVCFRSMRCIVENTFGKPFEMIQKEDIKLHLKGMILACPHLTHILVEETDNLLRLKKSFAQQVDFNVVESLSSTCSLRKILLQCLECYAERPCFGTPLRNLRGDIEYEWKSYIEIRNLACGLAIAMRRIVSYQSIIAICAQNRLEWYLTDLACVLGGFASAGIHSSWSIEDQIDVLCSSGSACLVADFSSLRKLLKSNLVSSCPDLNHIVVMDILLLDQDTNLQDLKRTENLKQFPRILFMSDILSGDANVGIVAQSIINSDRSFELPQVHNDDDLGLIALPHSKFTSKDSKKKLFSLIYTSGSTGKPKGAVITEFGQLVDFLQHGEQPSVNVSYLPCAWATDRTIVWDALSRGSRIGFSPPPPQLFINMQILRPTEITLPPAILNLLYEEHIKVTTSANEDARAKSMQILRALLGDRLRHIVTGGALSSDALKKWAQECFQVSIYDGYGTTEGGSVTVDSIVSSGSQVRLEQVPEMNYFLSDKPYPRGEILVKSSVTSPGYFRNPTETKEKITEDGWFRTGDIGEMIGLNQVRIIDRKQNLFKLSLGEFISPSRLEEYFSSSTLVKHVYIYGDSTKSFVLAAVTLSEKGNGMKKEDILREFHDIGIIHNLKNFEIPKDIIVDSIDWGVENGLLTATLKVNRYNLQKRYQTQFNNMYAI